VDDQVVKSHNGGVGDGLGELALAFGCKAIPLTLSLLHSQQSDVLQTSDLRLVRHVRELALLAGVRNKDFISGQVACSSVVASVGDTPRVERHKQDRMQHPSDRIVDKLGRRVATVPTLVGNDPNTSAEETSDKRVGRVKSDFRSQEGGVGKFTVSRQSLFSMPRTCQHAGELYAQVGKERVNVVSAVNQDSKGSEVLDDIEGRSEGRSVEAMSRNGIEELLDSVVWHDKLLALGDLFILGFTDQLLFFQCPGVATLAKGSHNVDIRFGGKR